MDSAVFQDKNCHLIQNQEWQSTSLKYQPIAPVKAKLDLKVTAYIEDILEFPNLVLKQYHILQYDYFNFTVAFCPQMTHQHTDCINVTERHISNDDLFLYTSEAFLIPNLETLVVPLSRKTATVVIFRYHTRLKKR